MSARNRTSVRVVELFGLAICTVHVVVPSLATVSGLNALVTLAWPAMAGTVSSECAPWSG
jgi:hypothetical protein